MTFDQEHALFKAVDTYLADCRYHGCPTSTRHIASLVVAAGLGSFRFSKHYRYEYTAAHRAIFEAVDTVAANRTADEWQASALMSPKPSPE